MSTILPFVFVAYPLVISSVAIAWLGAAGQRGTWELRVLASMSVVAFMVIAAPWAFSSTYLRFIVLIGFSSVTVHLLYKSRAFSIDSFTSIRVSEIPSVAVFVVFTLLCGFVVASKHTAVDSIELTFPFRSGTYYVLQGGSNAVTNPFHEASKSKHALDIVKLRRSGNRAAGLVPRQLTSYEIFSESVYSPCSGDVSRVVDGLPDKAPGNPDTANPTGNHVVLSCFEAEIVLGHLKDDSINVKPGDPVREGQLLAAIGNSGYSLEPHLHMAATKKGKGVAMTFGGRMLTMNDTIRIGPVNR